MSWVALDAGPCQGMGETLQQSLFRVTLDMVTAD